MALNKFSIQPNQSGYSVKDGSEILRAQLDGGQGRYRADILNSASLVNVQWTFNQGEYRYFRAFFNTTIERGSLPFLLDLIIDDSELTEHEVRFIPDSISLNQVVATQTFTVNAQLEVTPITQDAEYDAALVMLVEEYGDFATAEEMINQLEQLANVDMPGSLPG